VVRTKHPNIGEPLRVGRFVHLSKSNQTGSQLLMLFLPRNMSRDRRAAVALHSAYVATLERINDIYHLSCPRVVRTFNFPLTRSLPSRYRRHLNSKTVYFNNRRTAGVFIRSNHLSHRTPAPQLRWSKKCGVFAARSLSSFWVGFAVSSPRSAAQRSRSF